MKEKPAFARETRLRAVVGRRQINAENDRTSLDRLAQRQGRRPRARGSATRPRGRDRSAQRRRIAARLVLFGEQIVEADGGDIRLRQRLHQIRHLPTRPGPFAHEVDRFVVDVDDPDRLAEIVRPRLPSLVLVEHEVVDVRPERREQRAARKRQNICAEDHEDIGAPLLELAHRPLRPLLHLIVDRSGKNEGRSPPLNASIVAERG